MFVYEVLPVGEPEAVGPTKPPHGQLRILHFKNCFLFCNTFMIQKLLGHRREKQINCAIFPVL